MEQKICGVTGHREIPAEYMEQAEQGLRGEIEKAITDGYAAYVFPRSSLAAKGVVCELPPVDSGYRGEIHAIVSNVGNEARTLPKDSRIGQLIIMPVVIADFVNDLGGERGKGAFGSTGK